MYQLMVYGLWEKREWEIESLQNATARIASATKKINDMHRRIEEGLKGGKPIEFQDPKDLSVPVLSENYVFKARRYSVDDVFHIKQIMEENKNLNRNGIEVNWQER